MHKYVQELRDFFRKGDMILLGLCLLLTIIGGMAFYGCTALAKAKLPPEMEEAQAGAVQKMREELAKRYLEKMGAEYAQIEDWVRIICAVLV